MTPPPGSGHWLHEFGIAEIGDEGVRSSIYHVQLTLVFYDARSGKMLGNSHAFDTLQRAELPADLSTSAEDLEQARQQLTDLIRSAALAALRVVTS